VRPTLLYLPHCPRQLSNNLLAANWRPAGLARLVLLANSFAGTVERAVGGHRQAPLLEAAVREGIVREVPVRNSFKYKDIFNDTSLHTFHGLAGVEEAFWRVPEPQYGEDAEFIRAAGK
jgi:hypothetical protein